MRYTAHSLDELRQCAQTLLDTLVDDISPQKATVVGLSGELGAGKTTFVQTLARELGITETITSPTFVIQKRYPVPKPDTFTQLVHIDAYRLEGREDLEKLSFAETLAEPATLVCIEWPEKVAGALPEDAHRLVFTSVDETTRTIDYAKEN